MKRLVLLAALCLMPITAVAEEEDDACALLIESIKVDMSMMAQIDEETADGTFSYLLQSLDAKVTAALELGCRYIED